MVGVLSIFFLSCSKLLSLTLINKINKKNCFFRTESKNWSRVWCNNITVRRWPKFTLLGQLQQLRFFIKRPHLRIISKKTKKLCLWPLSKKFSHQSFIARAQTNAWWRRKNLLVRHLRQKIYTKMANQQPQTCSQWWKKTPVRSLPTWISTTQRLNQPPTDARERKETLLRNLF